MSFQAHLQNLTPFSAATFPQVDQHGQEVLLVLVVATFEASEREPGVLRLAPVQQAPHVADVYNGAPERASVRYESDVALLKPRVDVLVNGVVHTPREKAAESVRVALALGDIRKELIVTGDRQWRMGPLGQMPSRPKPFVTLPLVYDRAYGGIDDRSDDPARHRAESRNLSGVGFKGVRSHDPAIETEVPNVEYPHDRQDGPSDAPAPAGLSVVSRSWQPRLALAGRFDAEWLDRQWPLLPTDFSPAHYQAAPLDQQSDTLQGGEPVGLLNLTPNGTWRFRLPVLDLPITLYHDQGTHAVRPRMDTVLIEPEAWRVTMTSRLCIPIRRNTDALREIAVGHGSPGHALARKAHKRYLGRGGLAEKHYRL